MSTRPEATLIAQFNDALIARGIIPPRPERTPSPEPPPPEPRRPHLSDDSDDDLLDEDEDALPNSVLERYRAERLADLRSRNTRARFGEILPITKSDYTREVTEASRGDGRDSNGLGVVCFLYKARPTVRKTTPDARQDSEIESRLLGMLLKTLAARYPATKFCSIVADMCIEGYPFVIELVVPAEWWQRSQRADAAALSQRPARLAGGRAGQAAWAASTFSATGSASRPPVALTEAEVEDLLVAHGIVDQAEAVDVPAASAPEPSDANDENDPPSRRDKTSLRV